MKNAPQYIVVGPDHAPGPRKDGEHRAADVMNGQILGKELRLIEVCAGHGGVTAAWRKAGLKADEPIELYVGPDARTGRRPDHDLLQTEVQEALLRRARDPEGPNVWSLEPPCTSFCDFQKING